MGTLAALALATPIFGFALSPPSHVLPALDAAIVPQIEAAASAEASASSDSEPGEASASSQDEGEGAAEAPVTGDAYVAQVRRRAKVAKIHRTMGILTWAGMTLAIGSGTLQYRNLYVGDLEGTPCVKGNAWPNQSRCSGAPVPHLITSVLTGALYGGTLALSYMMPDPDNADEGSSTFAKRLRWHKALRWVHLVGMVAQIVMGPLFANPHLIGLDRVNDYGTLKALATAHLSVGYVTWGSMTAAGALMLF